jgi:pimeloyl-ACP methyl ester carboxylesterase
MNEVLVWLWQRPLLAPVVASAHRLAIEGEIACREVFDWRRRPSGPLVHWHESGSGKPLVLLNGFTASGLAWPTSWLRRLEKRYRVIRVDNRGTGWSREAPAPFTIGDMADDARDVLDALGIGKAVVLGMSMGGMIAQELAMRHPTRVERLVLTATIPPIPAAVPSTFGFSLGATLLSPNAHDTAEPSADQLSTAAQVWLRFAADGFAPAVDVATEMGRQALERITPMWSVVAQARAIYAWSGPNRLSQISAPTTVLHGEADRVVPIENARKLVALIKGAQLVSLPGVGHLVPWEGEDALVSALDD